AVGRTAPSASDTIPPGIPPDDKPCPFALLYSQRKERPMDVGRIGIWTSKFDTLRAAQAQEVARELEEMGYGAIWFPEAFGREAMAQSALLLAGTRRITVATGIANIYARDAIAMANGQRALAEAYPDRFLLGLGVSHAPAVEQVRGHRYERRPVAYMHAYLDAMDHAQYTAVPPPSEPRRGL